MDTHTHAHFHTHITRTPSNTPLDSYTRSLTLSLTCIQLCVGGRGCRHICVCQQNRAFMRTYVRAWNERDTTPGSQGLIFLQTVCVQLIYMRPPHHFLRWAWSLIGNPRLVFVEKMYSSVEMRSFIGEYPWGDCLLSTPDTLF